MKEHNIQGVVLAGVHRRDETGFDESALLPLMPIAQTPLICHVLGWLRCAGVVRATVCANKGSRRIRETLGDGAGLGAALDYYEDWTPRGPAGCIRDAAVETNADVYVVVDSTIMPRCDLRSLLLEHIESGAAMTITAARDPASSDERATPVGIYVLNHAVLEHIPATGYQDVKEVLLPHLHRRGIPVAAHVLATPCARLTDSTSYLAMNALALEWLSRGECAAAEYRRMGGCLVHETARVDETGALIGPALIGPGTRVERGATIVGPTSIGANCQLEANSAICRSVAWDGCRVGARSSVNKCILSDGARVEAGESVHQAFRASAFAGEAGKATPASSDRWLSLTSFTDGAFPKRDLGRDWSNDRLAEPSSIGVG